MNDKEIVRVVTYNILTGGYNLQQPGTTRTVQLLKVLQAIKPAILGIVESSHPLVAHEAQVLKEIADTLRLQLIMNEARDRRSSYQIALLTSLPVVSVAVHHGEKLLSKPVLEVGVLFGERPVQIFLVHLTAAFRRYRGGQQIHRQEVRELLSITAPCREGDHLHLIMGDFNTLGPTDTLRATHLLQYLLQREQVKQEKDGLPSLDFVVPPSLRWCQSLLRFVPRLPLFARVFDVLVNQYISHTSLQPLLDHDYLDCYRHMHPLASGLTYPAQWPAGRIDFIFASSQMAPLLQRAEVFTGGEDVHPRLASDHLPLLAEFVS